MKLIITTEAKDEDELESNLQAIRNSVFMGDIEDAELDGQDIFFIGNHTSIELT